MSKFLTTAMISPLPIQSSKPTSQISRRCLVARSEAVDSSKILEVAHHGLSEVVEKKRSSYTGGNVGLHTGRDSSVRKPEWLRQRAPQGEKFSRLQESLSGLKLNTVCVEAQCCETHFVTGSVKFSCGRM